MTKTYYNENATKYIEDTVDIDMGELYEPFLSEIPAKSEILDIGFGSGRDIIYFSKKHSVTGIDTSEAFVENIKSKIDADILLLNVLDMSFTNKFDGIWACASLLHLKKDELSKAFIKCYLALKQKGFMYASFKEGSFEGVQNGRYFTYVSSKILAEILRDTGFFIKNITYTFDKRPNRQEKWINLYLSKGQ